MNKILNWTVGSFFRTIGRTIAFLVMGGLIYFILSTNDIDFGIKNLFFEKLDALTLTSEVQESGSGYFTLTTSNFEQLGSLYFYTLLRGTSMQYLDYYFQTPIDSDDSDYVSFPLQFGVPEDVSQSYLDTDDFVICRTWTCESWNNSGSCDQFKCLRYYTSGSDEDYDYVNYQYQIQGLNIYPRVFYSGGGWKSCSFDSNSIVCPTNHDDIYRMELQYMWNPSHASDVKIGIGRGWTKWKTQNIQGAIQDQTQQQQQQHQEMMDSNTTQAENDASNFFSGFSVNLGGLTGIITAPLNTIQSLLNSSCTNLVLPLPFVNKNLTLPCMNDIYTTHFGLFFSLYQTIILGIIAYRCIMSIFFDIKGFTNPDDDRIEVMDL